MSKVTFIEPDGREHLVTAEHGQTLMQCAQEHLVPGILGDCGGCCSCGTCHAYLDQRWQAQTGEASDDERLLLEGSDHVRPESRLTCQVRMTAALDGLIVRLPLTQR